MVHKALELVEIRDLIGSFLIPSELVPCLRVCKAWQASFEPIVWRFPPPIRPEGNTDTIRLRNYMDSEKQPSASALQARAHYIHTLRFWGSLSPDRVPLGCHRLERLDISNDSGAVIIPEFWERISTGPMQSPVLEIVHLAQQALPPISNPFMVSLMTRQTRIKKFALLRAQIPDLNVLRHVCAKEISLLYCSTGAALKYPLQLHTSSMGSNKEQEEKHEAHSIVSGVQYMYLATLAGIDPVLQLAWLAQFPNLTRLYWSMPLGASFPEKELCTRAETNAWPWPILKEIRFVQKLSPPQDKTIATLLQAIGPGLEKLEMIGSRIGFASAKVLSKRHFATLSELDVSLCQELPSLGLQLVLSSCPRLKSIRAQTLWGQDVARGQPWVCLQLEEFVMGIIMPDAEYDVDFKSDDDKDTLQYRENFYLDQKVYQQLSRLTVLMKLDLRRATVVSGTRPLSHKLEHGLTELLPLTRIQFVRFYGLLDDEAMRWVNSQWRR